MAVDRGLSAALDALASAAVVRPILFVHLDIDGDPVRAHSWPGLDVAFNPDGEASSPEWVGAAFVGSISEIQENAAIDAYTITLGVSGVPSGLVALALGVDYQGRRARIWLGLLDDQWRLGAPPVMMFRGTVDTMRIAMGETASIAVTLEDRRADWRRPKIRRYTDPDQRETHPDDLGFRYVPQMAERRVNWSVGVR